MAVQWYEVFDEALRTADVVAVTQAITSYLGRQPTRSELNAGRRAANRYAAIRSTHALHVQTNNASGRRQVLLIARADVDLTDSERLHAIASGEVPPRRSGRHGPPVVENLVAAVIRAGRSARLADASQLDPEHAAGLAEDLAQPLRDLERLRLRLRRRGRIEPG